VPNKRIVLFVFVLCLKQNNPVIEHKTQNEDKQNNSLIEHTAQKGSKQNNPLIGDKTQNEDKQNNPFIGVLFVFSSVSCPQ
jgi:hypothetical protein